MSGIVERVEAEERSAHPTLPEDGPPTVRESLQRLADGEVGSSETKKD